MQSKVQTTTGNRKKNADPPPLQQVIPTFAEYPSGSRGCAVNFGEIPGVGKCFSTFTIIGYFNT